jgi:hypothetical protein
MIASAFNFRAYISAEYITGVQPSFAAPAARYAGLSVREIVPTSDASLGIEFTEHEN